MPKKENGKLLSKPERRIRQAKAALGVLENFLGTGVRAVT